MDYYCTMTRGNKKMDRFQCENVSDTVCSFCTGHVGWSGINEVDVDTNVISESVRSRVEKVHGTSL